MSVAVPNPPLQSAFETVVEVLMVGKIKMVLTAVLDAAQLVDPVPVTLYNVVAVGDTTELPPVIV